MIPQTGEKANEVEGWFPCTECLAWEPGFKIAYRGGDPGRQCVRALAQARDVLGSAEPSPECARGGDGAGTVGQPQAVAGRGVLRLEESGCPVFFFGE